MASSLSAETGDEGTLFLATVLTLRSAFVALNRPWYHNFWCQKISLFILHMSALSADGSKYWKQLIECMAPASFFPTKKKLIPKTLEFEKEVVGRVALLKVINTAWEYRQIAKHKSVRSWSSHRNSLCFAICRLSQLVFICDLEQPHAQSLFLFPIVFDGIVAFVQKPSFLLEKPRLRKERMWQESVIFLACLHYVWQCGSQL